MSLNNSWFSIQVQHGINVAINISHFSRQTGLFESKAKVATSDFIDSQRELGIEVSVKRFSTKLQQTQWKSKVYGK